MTSQPSTMRAAQVSRFGTPDDILTVADQVPRPVLSAPNTLLLKVHAVSLSPSDYRMTSGNADLFKPPKSTVWPYIPGGDVCGVVVETHPSETRFKPGDEVISTWDEYGMGGLAEYCIVDAKLTEHKPRGISFVEGAALADSPVNAMLAIEDSAVKAGDRVLILGGSGAVGTHAIQIAKQKGAFVAVTSTNEKLCKELGADVVVNYKETKWWEVEDFQKQPFDVVVDCAEGKVAWERAQKHGIIKRKGHWQAVVQNEWHIEMHTYWHLIQWGLPVLMRTLCSRMLPWKPRYMMNFPAPRDESLGRLLKMVEGGKLKAVIDDRGPWEFSTEGVRGAFNMMESRRARGKVVIVVRE